MTEQITVVGGGLGGLVSAIAAREAGFEVRVLEARSVLGGRARTTGGDHHANWGPHVVYSDGVLWDWLDARGLARPAGRLPIFGRFRFRIDGRARAVPPMGFVRALLTLRRTPAPIDASFREWASTVVDDPAPVARLASFMGVATFDHDPGRWSAAFVQGVLARASSMPPSVRYVPGGWATMIDRLAGRAQELGVTIETDHPVDALPGGRTILAVPLPRAAALLDDHSLTWTGARTLLLDLGLRARRGDPFVVSDLDESGWVETYSRADRTLAPAGERLVQAQMGLRPDESLAQGEARLEHLLDVTYPRWRERETWRRRARIEDESGALDRPGTSWRDRPAIDRGDGVHLVGDMVAAPGLLSEVAVNAAITAVESLVRTRPRAAA